MSTVVADVGGAAQGVIPSKSSLPLPLPVMLGIAGGGIGLIVFLMRKSQSAGTTSSTSGVNGSTLLPNTAIMLGSLQQGVLDLKGQIGTDNAALGNQIATGNNALSALIGATTQQTQQLVSDSSGQITTAMNNGFSNQSTEAAAAAGGLATLLGNQGAQIGALGTGITNLASTVTSQNQALVGTIGTVDANAATRSTTLMNALTDWFNLMFGNQAQTQGAIGQVNQSVWASNGMTGSALANIGSQVAAIKKG